VGRWPLVSMTFTSLRPQARISILARSKVKSGGDYS
jgi:hypothetical protein